MSPLICWYSGLKAGVGAPAFPAGIAGLSEAATGRVDMAADRWAAGAQARRGFRAAATPDHILYKT